MQSLIGRLGTWGGEEWGFSGVSELPWPGCGGMGDLLVLVSWPGPEVDGWQLIAEEAPLKSVWFWNSCRTGGSGRLEARGQQRIWPVLVAMVGWAC